MEASRLGILKIKAPSAVLSRKMFDGEIGEIGTAEGEFMVVGFKLVPNGEGGDIKQVIVKPLSLKKVLERGKRK